jgi:hypothetical protein
MNDCSYCKYNDYHNRIESLLSLLLFNIELNCFEKFGFT